MFICFDCGAVFDEPATYRDSRGEFWGAPVWETCGMCPVCGSTEYDTAECCERCGEYVPETHYFGNIKVCDICLEDLGGV